MENINLQAGNFTMLCAFVALFFEYVPEDLQAELEKVRKRPDHNIVTEKDHQIAAACASIVLKKLIEEYQPTIAREH